MKEDENLKKVTVEVSHDFIYKNDQELQNKCELGYIVENVLKTVSQ